MIRLLTLITVTTLFAIGLVMIFSTTSAEVLDHDLSRSTHQALVRQMLYAVAGFALASVVWKVGYKRMLSHSPQLLALFTFLLVLVLIPGIGREVNGSKRWISLAGLSFQPSEFVKYLIPAYFIHTFLQFKDGFAQLKDFLFVLGKIAVPMILVLIEPNNGTVAVIGMSIIVLCLLTQVPFRYWGVPLLVFLTVGAVSATNLPYVTARLKVYLHPELDLKGKGHQPYQAKIAAGSGNYIGRGPGNSLQKLSYLPEAQNDYIAAIYAEEFGFAGIFVLICLYMLLGYCGFHITYQTQDWGAFYLAATITFLVCFQAFLNLGVVSGLLPSTGLNLPLFSQGGSSLMANITVIGLLLNIESTSTKAKEFKL